MRDKLGRFVKGKSASPETQFKKGLTPWNKDSKGYKVKTGNYNYNSGFQKGHLSYNKGGNKWSEKSRIKFSSTQQGIKVSEWDGFKSSLNHRLRTSAKYQIWRNAVFLRDNFTCQNHNCKFCNNKIGVFLNAHHMKSVAEFPELMFSINNGITYCEEFHFKGNLHQGIAKKQLNFIGGKIL